jgi:hypothetical protein
MRNFFVPDKQHKKNVLGAAHRADSSRRQTRVTRCNCLPSSHDIDPGTAIAQYWASRTEFQQEMIMNTTMTMNAGYQTTAYAPIYARRNEYEAAIATAKFVAMLVAAPLIGLAAVTIAPLVGLAVLIRMAFQALPKRVKDVALFFAAPFVGLAYLMAFPLIGIGMLVWMGVRPAPAK